MANNLPHRDEPRPQRTLRLLLDGDTTGVAGHSVELGRSVDLDDDRALVHQSIRAPTDDAEKRKEIARSKRVTKERIDNDYDHGCLPIDLTYDDRK
jgi:hypothetical protein